MYLYYLYIYCCYKIQEHSYESITNNFKLHILKQNEAKSIFIALHFAHIWIVNMIYLIITIIIIVCTQPHPRGYTLALITETMLKERFNWGISKACEVPLGKSHTVGYWQVYLPLERDSK